MYKDKTEAVLRTVSPGLIDEEDQCFSELAGGFLAEPMIEDVASHGTARVGDLIECAAVGDFVEDRCRQGGGWGENMGGHREW